MTTEPAKLKRSEGTDSAAAIGGPLPPLRLLLANGNGRDWRASLGFLVHTAVIAVLFLLPLLVTEEISGSPPWRTITILPIQKGSPEARTTTRPPRSSGPQTAGPASGERPQLTLSNHPNGPKGARGVQIAGPDFGLESFGIPDGIDGGVSIIPPSQFIPVTPAAAAQPPVRVGGKVRPPRLLRRVEQLTVLGGHPLLVEAAQQAVPQWVYEPTYLNERPVPVLLRVTLEFRLRR